MSDGGKLAPLPSSPAPAPVFAEPATRPTVSQPKMRKPSAKVRDAIHAYVSGRAKTKKAAAKLAGISREFFARSLSQVHVAEYLRACAAREVATSAGRAAARLNQLIDSTSQRVALEATKFSLGVAGIKPASDSVNVNVGVGVRIAGYCIDLSEPGRPMKIVAGGQIIDATAEAIAGIGGGREPASE